jgi:DNA-binding NarL/FixJ family response regulator
MLPPQFAGKLMQGETTGASQVQPKAALAAISDAIEHSVSETLSSQLNKMFAEASDTVGADEADQLPIRLSERQMQVLRLLGQGKTNNEIAQALFRSPNTIKLHVSAILKQLRLKSRTQAALLAAQLDRENSIRFSDFTSSKKTRRPLVN